MVCFQEIGIVTCPLGTSGEAQTITATIKLLAAIKIENTKSQEKCLAIIFESQTRSNA